MSTTILTICILCAIAFILTYKLGTAQNPEQNKKYHQNRRKTVFFLTAIYGVVLIFGIALIYFVL